MEDFRSRVNLVPQPLGARAKQNKPAFSSNTTSSTPSVISIASTSDSPPPKKPDNSHRTVWELSDSEDDGPRGNAPPQKPKQSLPRSDLPLTQRRDNMSSQSQKPPSKYGAGIPIHIPSNRDLPKQPVAAHNALWETFDEPKDDVLYDPIKGSADAEKDLKDLLQQTFDGREEGEGEGEPIDMSEAIVEGFKDGITLLPHQVVGRRWMAERESGKKTGGILADDMGLGKTIQTITRIVDGKPRRSDKEDGWAAATLVISPVGLVGQWADEISKMAKGLRVIQHHGQSRTTDPSVLEHAHVVVTSYNTVSSEYAAYTPDAKDESKAKKKSQKKKSLDSDSESDELSSETFGRTLKAKKPASKSKQKDALFRVKWWRIVLDEAHNIRNRNTKASQACCALEGKYRWCLTGTPLQNSVEDIYALLKFLRVRPLNDWQRFNEQIFKPVKSGKSVRAMKRLHVCPYDSLTLVERWLTAIRASQVVLKAIMLRRQKTDMLNGRALIELPKRNLDIIHCAFDDEERQFYESVEHRIEEQMQKLLRSGDVMKNYTHVLVLLLRLRQACNHPSLVSKDYKVDRDAVESRPATKEDDDADGLAALLGQATISDGRKCQVCQTSLTSDNIAEDDEHCKDCIGLVRRAARKSIGATPGLPAESAKTRKILELLEDISSRTEEDGEPSNEKTIIFSQFTSMLDIIEQFLKHEGIKFARYDGSMTKDKREASLEKIRNSKSTHVILISFKAGGVGLNLTACNNVILVDLWWNPALEEQAFDRAHRFGQKRDVNIYKLTIEKTVEERILALQDTKRALANAALSGDKLKNNKLGLDDLMALFRPGRDDDEDED
ncbi:hypothetical protein EVG20_g5717 [Dentipellis fragilis]|uniref:Helicase ATP-binding domain-containing protein n=1 Tax=Dentipellis fragilis TaxID=205917 RepID=A0A4Y9YRM9_9AGAM|nr:hypothetical protein EVG20_g5717 [Dentipellis fragilis]